MSNNLPMNVISSAIIKRKLREGFTESDIHSQKINVQQGALAYFKNCQEVLGNKEMKYYFTKKEVILLELNNINVNPISIEK